MSRCRYLTFSLRTLFILLTLFAVWTATIVNRVRGQREAREAIEALGWEVLYDWHLRPAPSGGLDINPNGKPTGPAWIRKVIGSDFFQEVTWATSPEPPCDENVKKAIPHLQRLRGLKAIWIPWGSLTSEEVAALPNCELNWF
jgi:hypothetical protein